jgi:hydroxypyruvate reductase 1
MRYAEDWADELFGALKAAGGKVFSNYAVGYNNVNVPVRSHTCPRGWC